MQLLYPALSPRAERIRHAATLQVCTKLMLYYIALCILTIIDASSTVAQLNTWNLRCKSKIPTAAMIALLKLEFTRLYQSLLLFVYIRDPLCSSSRMPAFLLLSSTFVLEE